MGYRAILFLLLAAGVACSSTDEDASSDQSGGTGGAGGTETPGDDATGATGSGSRIEVELPGKPSAEGGTRVVTQAEIDAMRSSACAGWSAAPEPQATVLELVVDVSNSMNVIAPGSTESKWVVTRRALEEALASLPAETAVGIAFYPAMTMETPNPNGPPRPVSQCIDSSFDVPVAPLGAEGSEQRLAILASLSSVGPDGGTPTYDAYLLGLQALADSAVPGERFIALITDGQPTYSEGCVGTGQAEDAVDTAPIVDAIRDARADGLRTFVIGSPGSEQSARTGEDVRPWLSQAASEGGTGRLDCSDAGPSYCHFDMSIEPSFEAGLERALGDIAGQVVSCEYALPTPEAGKTLEPDAVNVIYTSGTGEMTLLLKDDDPACQQGWHYSEDGSAVLLCEESCATAKADARGAFELMFGCASYEAPVR